MKNKLFTLFLALMAGAGTVFAQSSGTCGKDGNNLTWTLSGGTLTISGTGDMADYSNTNPWYDNRSSIKSVVIEAGVTSIGKYAFYNCDNLTSMTIPGSVTSIGNYAFNKCSSLASVTIPKGVISIGPRAFQNCTSLTSIALPEGITSISIRTFYQCTSLKSVTIPASVANIYDEAFSGCNALTEITCKATTPPTCASNSFYAVTKSIPVYVPVGTVDDYQYESGWSDFSSNIQCMSLSGTCGANLTWELGCDSVLTISGTGDMTNWSDYEDVPWYPYRWETKTIVVQEGVTSFGYWAFYNIHANSVTIPSTVTSIGEERTLVWDFLSINVAEGNPNYCSVGGVLFTKDTTALIQFPLGKKGTYVIPNSVTSIRKHAFMSCSLTYITIPNGVQSIGHNSFSYCDDLISIKIPGSVTSLDTEAFAYSNDALTSITCEAVEPPTYGHLCFYGVPQDIPVYVPKGKVEAYKATDWNYFTNIQENPYIDSGICGDKGANLTWTLTEDGLLTISGTGNMQVFYGRSYVPWLSYDSSIKKVVIENGVTNIDQYAFYGCSNMTSVTIPNTVTDIRMRAFLGCTGLTSIEIPNSVESISKESFYGCSGLKSLVIPNSVQTILDDAFSKCTGLTSVTIPASVTYIGSSIFEGCFGLNSITVESGNTKFDSRDNCNAIIKTATNELIQGCKNTTIPNSVKEIGDYAFMGHTGLTSITIPSNVTSLGFGPFVRTGLTAFSVPSDHPNYCAVDGVLFTKDQTELIAYPGGRNGAYTIPDGVKTVGMFSFDYCEGLTAVTIPEGVETIGAYSFWNCNGLTSVTIPNSVTSIEAYGFRNCSKLANVTIGSGLTYLGLCGFYNCTALKSITCNAVTPPTCYGSCFYEVPKDIPLYVPEGSVASYKGADEWKDFNNIQEIGGGTGIETANSQEAKAKSQKILRNGQIFILRDGKVYTVTGQEVIGNW